MSIIYIVSGNSLDTFYEDTLQYLFEKYHSHAEANTNFSLSEEMEQSSIFAEGYLCSEEWEALNE